MHARKLTHKARMGGGCATVTWWEGEQRSKKEVDGL